MRDWHPVSAAKSTLPSARSPSPLRALYEAHSSFLPHPTLTSTNLITSLHILNLMQTTLSTDILRDRIRHITTTQDHACARALVSVIYETGFKLPRIGERHKSLFDRVLAPLDGDLRTGLAFRRSVGWDRLVDVGVLCEQLQDDVCDVVYDVVRELVERGLDEREIIGLRDVVAGSEWVPVGEESRLAGAVEFFVRMGCSERPSTSAILDRLAELREGDKSTRVVVTKACRLLSLLSDEEISDANHRSRVFVPDTSCTLRPLHSVLYNDIGERAVLVSLGDDEYLAYDMINESLARSLHMDRLGLKFVDLKPLGIDMGEELGTTIRNRLGSYTSRQIVTEFVANAADAGATEFGVLVDEITITLSSDGILFGTLKDVWDGPSFVLYNDAVFTAADFDGICQTGIGGKSKRRDCIGQFGFGALTMFHLTDFAMIVSGDSVLFIEPTKQLLPLRGRAALLLPLRHVKQMYPDHIKLLVGMFGFEVSSTISYQGTLFRLPLRRHVKESSLGEAWDIHRLREVVVKPFQDHAEEFLLFTSIGTIMIKHRTSLENVRTWRISSVRKEEMTVNEFKTRVFDLSIRSDIDGPCQDIETQSWHVVSTSTSCQEDILESLSRYRLRSPVMLAIAARTDTETDRNHKRKLVYKFFSSLPLIPSYLPVHVSAPFILSDDRRQIRLDNLDQAAADYNRWLFSTAIPPLCLFLLSDLLDHDHKNVPWWPGDVHGENQLTQLVTCSFYSTLKDSNRRVFLPSHWARAIPIPLTSKEVVLADSHSVNGALDEVFRLLEPPLVLLPSRLIHRLHTVGLTQLTPAYLSNLVRRSLVNPAKYLRFEQLSELLSFLGRQSADDLLGLRLLPLSSGEFGMIERSTGASETYFIAPKSAHVLFPASQHLVHPKFKPSMSVCSHLLRTLNVEEFTGSSLNLLIVTVLHEGSVASHDNDIQAWIASFWNKCADMNVNLESISTFPLVPTRRPGLYTSIDNCRNRSAVILGTRRAHAWLWSLLSDLGLTVVECYSENFPRYLRDTFLENQETLID
ncbi:Sacsin [Termitomyces sp. J132]|nr:Sacsin [Termitomyces sp. J132]